MLCERRKFVFANLKQRNMQHQWGKYIIVIGLIVIIIGIVVYFFGDKLSWLGRLPGDIRIERENVRIYIPIVTMLLLSVLFSAILWLIRQL